MTPGVLYSNSKEARRMAKRTFKIPLPWMVFILVLLPVMTILMTPEPASAG